MKPRRVRLERSRSTSPAGWAIGLLRHGVLLPRGCGNEGLRPAGVSDRPALRGARGSGAGDGDGGEGLPDADQFLGGQREAGGSRGSPRGGAASWSPGSARSTASARAARRARSAPGSPSSAAAIGASRSTSAWFALRASGVKRGTMLRKSSLANEVFSSIAPVRKPLPSGLKGTKPMPELLQRRQDLLLGLAPPERVLALQRRHRLDRVRAPDGLRRRPRTGRSA